MKTLVKYNRIMMFLTTLMLVDFVQAQIEIGQWVDHKYSVVKTYYPSSIFQMDNHLLIPKLNINLKKLVGVTVDPLNRSCAYSFPYHLKKITALDEKIDWTKTGFGFLYYKEIASDKHIRIYKENDYWRVNFYLLSGKKGIWDGLEYEWQMVGFEFSTLETAQEFAENMYYILQPYRDKIRAEFKTDSIRFVTLSTKYRESKEKPIITEEQRKYIVQANAMNEKKEYGKAIELYNKTLEINPVAYPGAYYNLALLCAQTKEFQQAIYNMKKYLLLVPDAPDTRAAQDKIYEWEAEPKD